MIKITKFRVFSGLAIAVMTALSIWSYVLAGSPATVTDNFDDSSQIASSTQVTVAGGVVTLSAASTWTCGDTLIDTRDSKTYSTVLIGSQCWMAENINVGTLTAGLNEQGTDCPSASEIEKYCYDNNEGYCTTYGGLYQWNQAMCGSTTEGATGICPTGWHIPTDAEWYILEYGFWDTITGACASDRTIYDCSPAGTQIKSGGGSGFSGLLAGYRSTSGSFSSLFSYALFWSSLQSSSNAWFRRLDSGAAVSRGTYCKAGGLSVRCLKN